MAAHKGSAKVGGRAKGTLNKVTFEIRELARVHGPAAICRLVQLKDEAGPIAVAACRELLDRGYGKAPQPHDGDGQGGPVKIVFRWEN